MDGLGGYPLYNGTAAYSGIAPLGSSSLGGNNFSSVNVFAQSNNAPPAFAVDATPAVVLQHHNQNNYHQQNSYLINNSYQQQLQQRAGVNWTHPGTIPSFISHQQLNQYNNYLHPALHQQMNTPIVSTFYPIQHPNRLSAPPPPAPLPPPSIDRPLKDLLLEFFAEGQCESLSVFCGRNDALRMKLSRELDKYSGLQCILKRRKERDARMGFTNDESTAASNIIHHVNQTSPESSSPSPVHLAQQYSSAMQILQKTVRDAFNTFISFDEQQKVVGREDLLHNEPFINSMRQLKRDGITKVSCGHGYNATSCQSPSCNTVMLVRNRSDNQQCCKSCAKNARHEAKVSVQHQQNFEKRTAPDSKSWNLSPAEQRQKNQNNRNEKKQLKRTASRLLKRQIERELDNQDFIMRPVEGDEEDDKVKEQQFISWYKDILGDLFQSNDKNKVKQLVKELIKSTMSSIVENDKSEKNPVDVEESEIDDLVAYVVDGMMNTSKKLNGKEKQCQFSPTMLAMADALYATSPSAFRQGKAHTPLHILPSERTMQRRKAENKIPDGQTSKPYELKKEEMRRRGITVLKGYLECDEMKLKEGVVFRTKTNEPVGLANDMLDLESVLRRMLSEEGHKLKNAKYVNQWQFVAITNKGVEYVLLEYFFNDGSLTAKTLSNQFRHVVFMCEAVNMRVSGLCYDAGGNNSRLFTDLHRGKKIGHDPWLNDEDCYIVHPFDPLRRIYIWFCTTHVLKAMRNQVLTSQQGGAKAFLDKNDYNISWHFVQELYTSHVELEKKTAGKCTSGLRLTETVVNPNKSKKMDVRVAKIPFEDKTLAFAIESIINDLNHAFDALNLTFDTVLEETEEVRSGYIPRQSESKEKSFSSLRHGHYVEIARYLMKVYNEGMGIVEPAKETEEQSPNDDVPVEECVGDAWDELDGLDDDELERLIGNDDLTSTYKKSEEVHSTPDTLGDRIATLIYFAHVNALFHNFAMCRKEKITLQNVDLVEDLIKGLLSYFGEWKVAQLKRKAAKFDEYEKTFLAPQTYRNLRYSICPFIHFSRYILNSDEGYTLRYSPLLLSSSSSLENVYSCQRRTNNDTATGGYQNGISCMTSKSRLSQSTGKHYLAEDCLEGSDNHAHSGFARAKKAREEADTAIANLKATRESINRARETCSLFQHDQPPVRRKEFKDLARELNTSLNGPAMDIVMNSKSFQFFVRLCHDDEDNRTFAWLENLVSCEDAFFNQMFHNITVQLLRFFEEELYSRSSSFESSIFQFIASTDFHSIFVEDLLEFEGSISRLGTIAIFDAIVECFTERVFNVISEKNVIEEEEKITADSPCFPRMLQNIVGSTITKSRDKFCPSGFKSPESILFSSLGIKRDDPLVDDEYKERWYVLQTQIENQGMLTLIHPKFIPWSVELLLFTIEAFSDRRMIIHRLGVIQVGMKELVENKELYNKFETAVKSSMDVKLLSQGRLHQIYVRLCERIFHSYIGKHWYDRFNKPKDSTDDMNNIQFRHQLQLMGSKKSTNTSSNTQNQSNQRGQQPPLLATVMGIGVKKKRKRTGQGGEGKESKRRKKIDEQKEAYRQLYKNEVVPKLLQLPDHETKTVVSTSKLLKKHRLALLFVKFGIFHKEGDLKVDELKELLEAELNKEENKLWSGEFSKSDNNTAAAEETTE